MGTIVSFHAHPDDESIATGGLLARAADAGHRVVLVFGTRGELGEPVPGSLAEGEQLTLRRTQECFNSAQVLGVPRVEFLGWTDSGMIGLPTNDVPWCFWQADVEHAASRLALILREEQADLITIYDDNGGYGHPDHIQVHRVGVLAGQLAGVGRIFESTMNRDELLRQLTEGAEAFAEEMGDVEMPDPDDFRDMGTPESGLTHAIDVGEWSEQKRRSMRCHESQIPDDSFFLRLPDDVFRNSFGTEWFIEHGATRGPGAPFGASLFDSL